MSSNTAAAAPQPTRFPPARPVLKWAGGKTQLLPQLLERAPKKFNRYIEPFVGGGAFFFALQPHEALIADINPELINLYRSIRDRVDDVIEHLRTHLNTPDHFYEVRAQDWTALEPAAAAARTIFLNRTCFNGLYRVNRSGGFNVPYGNYKNPTILDAENLTEVARRLQYVDILEGNYRDVLRTHAHTGDFVYLDPPYLPVGEYSDFKRYSKEQFYEEDHRELALEIERLHEIGCHVILTNSNHPLVHELYRGFQITLFQTKRNISARADRRTGEDVIVELPPRRKLMLQPVPEPIDDQTSKYPSTRFMGSKSKLLAEIWQVASQFEFETILDLFAGSGIVSYMFKAKGKRVLSNDYMAFSANLTQALVANSFDTLPLTRAQSLVETPYPNDGFIATTFNGLYYSDSDNAFLDSMRAGIATIRNPNHRAIALAALVRACLKKRPRGIFTYTGMRYDDGRQDLQMTLAEHFLNAVDQINAAVFDNHQKCQSRHGDAMTVAPRSDALVYIDPPYYSPYSDNEYVRRYHFVEGLTRYWQGVQIQEHTTTKKFKSYPTPFSTRNGAYDAFDKLFRRHRNSILLVSYSSNSQPTLEEMVGLISQYKQHVEVVPIDHRYSFGNQGTKIGNNKNAVQEYLFVGYS